MNFQILLYAHIAFGMVSLIAGAVSGFSTKGSPLHRKSGKTFAVSMLLAATSAIALSIIRPSSFLLAIGLFTLYLILSGWIWVWRIPQSRKVKLSRYAAIFGMAIALFMFYQSLTISRGIPIVLLVFGSILLGFSILDLIRKPNPINNVRIHAGRMGGAYIASFTAFIVTNLAGMLPDLVLWIGPTPIGSVLIALGIRAYYKNQKLGKRKARQPIKKMG